MGGRGRETEILRWCQPHWDALREAIDARGLTPWVSKGGEMAAKRVAAELGGQGDARGFDPLLRAWSMMNTRIVGITGNLFDCPLCQVQHHVDECRDPKCTAEPPQAYIDGCTDSLLAYARELGLVPKEQA